MANQHRPALPALALTMGEPAGIGGEIAVKAWSDRVSSQVPPFFVVDSPDRLTAIARHLQIECPVAEVEHGEEAAAVFADALPVKSMPVSEYTTGVPNDATASDVLRSLATAYHEVAAGRASGLVTNPIEKANLYKAGFEFQGHTDYLTHAAGITTPPVMMLACEELRVVPVTQHIAIGEVPGKLKADDIVEVTTIVDHALKEDFGVATPHVALAGLNPHAGEAGHIGDEELRVIAPAMEQLRMRGIRVSGPHAADSMFHVAARANFDAAICMYHDQALIPIKTIAFERAVNVTLGLPFVRTSPDHGTALDIAGKGIASPRPLIEALKLAAKMAERRASE